MSSSSSLSGGKYTRDLKLRVLEHYFRNGGDVFGNKQSTAKKFGIVTKTINRFLQIPELVRLARKNAKSSKSAASGSSDGFKEPLLPGASGSGGRPRPQRQSVRITLPSRTDESIVGQSADPNSSSIIKLLKIFELGTQEIRDLLAAECDLIYECRACRALFRSVADLLAHKRRYCTRPAADSRQLFGSGPGQSLSAASDGVLVLPLAPAVDRLPEVRQAAAAEARAAAAQPVPPVRLDPLPGSAAAVLQTVGEPERSVAERLAELRQMEAAADRTVRLGRDGRVVETDEEEEEEGEGEEQTDTAETEDGRHVCQHCNTTFSTRKTLSHHVRSLHSATRVYYPCSLCSAAFINMFSVERHLQKVHKKKQEEIDVLKEGIKQKSFQRNVSEIIQAVTSPASGASSAAPAATATSAATATPSTNAPVKIGPPPAGLLRCAECPLCYPSAQLLAAHQLTAHARSVRLRAESSIQVRVDYLNPRVGTAVPTWRTVRRPARSAAAEAASLTRHARRAPPASSLPPPSAPSASAPPTPAPAAEASAAAGAVAEEHATPATDKTMQARLNALIDADRIRCKQCGSVHKTIYNLHRHIAVHIGWTRFSCPRCAHRYYSRYDVIRHLKGTHKIPARRAEELLRRAERTGKTGGRSTGQRARAKAEVEVEEEAPAEAAEEVGEMSEDEEEGEDEEEMVQLIESSLETESMVPPQSTYEMRDLTVPRPAFPSESPSAHVFQPLVLPDVLPPRPPPLATRPVPRSLCPQPSPSLYPQLLPVAPPPTLARRRPGRKNLTAIIHYIRASAEPTTPESDPGGSSRMAAEGNVFQEVQATSEQTRISQRAGTSKEGRGDAEDVEATVEEDDDELAEFMSLSAGAELEPGAVWRTLPPLVPLFGEPRDGTAAPLPDVRQQRHEPHRPASYSSQQHDCNENIEHRGVNRHTTPPIRSCKSLPSTPKRSPVSPSHLQKRASDEYNFFPRVLLTDIALPRSNSSPIPARPASPSGGAVYPAGARLGTGSGGEADSPADRKGSPSGAASASGGVSPNGVEQERHEQLPQQPQPQLKKVNSEGDLSLVTIGETDAVAAAAAAAGRRSPDGSVRSLRLKGQRPVLSAARSSKRAFTSANTSSSSGTSPPVNGRRARRKSGVAAAAAAVPVVAPAVVKPEPSVLDVPSVWPPLVRKRSWSSPDDPPPAAISAAEAVKRRRHRRLSDRAGVS